jgi:uncharacterized protein (DUF924 family)
MRNEDYLEVIDYWFGPLDSSGFAGRGKIKMWFMGGKQLDDEIKQKFGPLVERAVSGDLGQWGLKPISLLALVILLDQFTRNIYRGSASAFAGDDSACRLAIDAINQGWDDLLGSSYCAFLYMPLEHSEDIKIQWRSVERFQRRHDQLSIEGRRRFENFSSSAVEHCNIIERFGRFPHRNDVMGRNSTKAELAYLNGNAPRFGQ